jgi:Bacterial PH domain
MSHLENKNFQEDSLIWNKKALPNRISSEEDIVLVVRTDVVIIAFKAFTYILGFLFLLAFKILLASFVTQEYVNQLYSLAFYTIILLMVISFAYYFHNYFLSIQIVTDKRLIDIDQRGLFQREVNELSIDKVEDVSYKQNGIFGAVFNYGHVTVQTAAEVSTESNKSSAISGGFLFENVPSPAEVHAIISDMYHRSKNQDAHFNARLQAEYMANMHTAKPDQD